MCDFKIEQKTIVARSRKLKARWTVECDLDISMFHFNMGRYISEVNAMLLDAPMPDGVHDINGRKIRIENGAVYNGNVHYTVETLHARVWMKNGKIHNENGPAIVSVTDPEDVRYYFKGLKLEKEKWLIEVRADKLKNFLGENDV